VNNENIQRNIRIVSQPLVVQATCMVSPLGPSVQHNLAALDAGVSAIAPSILTDPLERPYVTACVADEALPPLAPELRERVGAPRQQRLLRLAAAALGGDPLPRCETLFLCVPKLAPWEPEEDFSQAVLPWLAQQTGGRVDANASRVFDMGNAAPVVALQAAVACLQQGSVDHVWVGAVDSLCDRDTLDELDRKQQLVTAKRAKGILAGEAAVFMRLALAKKGNEVTFHASALAREPQHSAPAMAEQLLASGVAPPALLLPDFNGLEEPMRAWFAVAERIGARLANPQKMLLPSAQGGYAGVAHALWLLALAHHAAQVSQQTAWVQIGTDPALAAAVVVG
jgi:3-oxoacyl-[acyl-carrier-protein] synthase I